jgi:hypothetical protein
MTLRALEMARAGDRAHASKRALLNDMTIGKACGVLWRFGLKGCAFCYMMTWILLFGSGTFLGFGLWLAWDNKLSLLPIRSGRLVRQSVSTTCIINLSTRF